MRADLSNTEAFLPDSNGLFDFKVSGDLYLHIKNVLIQEFMTPTSERPDPPGIPDNFFLGARPLNPKMSRVMQHQESTVYSLYATSAARTFLIEKCGVEL